MNWKISKVGRTVIALMLCLSSCARTPAPPPIPLDATVTIKLARTACMVPCPVYHLTIESSGAVTYVGEESVEVTGIHTTTIKTAWVTRLITAFNEAGFMALNDEYTSVDVTDLPSAITSITVDGVTKQVHHYYGDRKAPPKLKQLETLIDVIVGVRRWTGQYHEFLDRYLDLI